MRTLQIFGIILGNILVVRIMLMEKVIRRSSTSSELEKTPLMVYLDCIVLAIEFISMKPEIEQISKAEQELFL